MRIFRKHDFAWGGNFLTPDGMHFEWVGEPRDQLQYPSTYCPNLADRQRSRLGRCRRRPSATVMFADDGWGDEHRLIQCADGG